MAGNKKGVDVEITRLCARYTALTARLRNPGLILQGTITERTIPAPDGKNKSYGPYYQWTRKVRAKTVTVNLSSSQVKKFQAAIINNSKLEQTVQNMRSLAQKICEATTTGVKKRKP